MFAFGQKLILEKFQLQLGWGFFIYFPVFSQNRDYSRNWRPEMLTKSFQAISDIINLQFSVLMWKFNLSQVKQYLISSIVNSVYKLLHELPNNLRLRLLGNLGMKRKFPNWVKTHPSVQPPLRKLIFGDSGQNLNIFHIFPIQFCLIFLLFTKYFANDFRFQVL